MKQIGNYKSRTSKEDKMRKGFTLLELLIVIIIIGVLAVIALTQYRNLTERARSSEAKAAIGSIRTAEKIYREDHGLFTSVMADLNEYITPLPAACATTNWFTYDLSATTANVMNIQCTRCTAAGKQPNSAVSYYLNITEDQTGVQLRQTNVSGVTPTAGISNW